jgi:hypothetical protein
MATAKRRTSASGGTRIDLAARARAIVAIRARAEHLTWAEAAARAGFGLAGACHNAVKRELKRDVHESLEEMRDAVGRDYDAVLAWLHPQIFGEGADPEHALWCLDRYGRFQSLRVALYGLALGEDEKRAVIPYRKVIELHHTYDPAQLPAAGETYDAGE